MVVERTRGNRPRSTAADHECASRDHQLPLCGQLMASKIDRDSVLTVKIRGLDQPLKASVVQLLSSTSDIRANTYSVPFPYAEQNSVYVVGTFAADLTDSQRAMTCNPGLWASAEVSRP